jgi:hypothetical protein
MDGDSIFDYKGFRVRITPAGKSELKIARVHCTGLVTRESYAKVRPRILSETADANAMLVHVENAVVLMDRHPYVDPDLYVKNAPAQAVIVRAENLALWMMHAEEMAAVGVNRVVFRPDQVSRAYSWVASVARLRMRQRRQIPEPSGPMPLA